MRGTRPVTAVIAEAKHRRPFSTSLAFAVIFAPLLALMVTFGLSVDVTLEDYLAVLVGLLALVTGVNVVSARMDSKLMPEVLTDEEADEVRRTVWLGTELARPRLAFAAILYSQRLMRKRSDIFMLVGGCVLLLVAIVGPKTVPGPAKVWFVGLALLFAAVTFAYYPAVRKARKRHGEALKRAEEMVRNS
ncbi:hypothetical protein [Actinocrispum sp. NPDC049592]|uniref:hypothetical protein n=1 Tax=Actinocrispum sp. NPDC049592 TaxID=3154835 RepID=UPI00342A6A23